ncbi:MAG: hypothetical protein M3Q58_04965 [Bacteroidota bacterium]|nr:hypothetical protein [Bacteroidota bacterium]
MENQTIKSEIYTSGERPKKGFFNFITWSSVFAGLVIAFIVQFLLTLLGIAIGMSTVQPLSQEFPMEGLGTGAIIWWIVTVLISLYTGGWVAGKFAGSLNTYGKVFHGILTFGMYTIISFWLLTTTVGSVISGVGSVIGETLAFAGRGAGELAPVIAEQMEERGITMQTIQAEIEAMIAESGVAGTTGAQVEDLASPEVLEAFRQYTKTGSESDKQALVDVIVSRTEMSRQEAMAEVNRLETRVEEITVEAEERARLVGAKVSKGISRAAIITFIALVLGAIAAAIGAGIAKRDYDVTNKSIGI